MIDPVSEPTDPVEHALRSFGGSANWSLLHQKDYERFYTFIVIAHGHGCAWDTVEVSRRLQGYVVAPDIIQTLATRFDIGMAVFRRQMAMKAKANGLRSKP